jgi:signal transduction histidine kinase
MAAEYRALRASVVRLWTEAEGALAAADIEDLTRFHEAIDQALAESVLRFNQDLEQSKETFLAILGHDLRTPLGAISTSADFLLRTPDVEEDVTRRLLMQIAGSATRSVTMVGDLLDFTRSRLGTGIPVVRKDVNLVPLLHSVVDEVAAAHPQHEIRLKASGEEWASTDPERLSQALGNLITNAVQHGDARSAVTVTLDGDVEKVAVAVHNGGAVISSQQLDGLFNPMRTRPSLRASGAEGPIGSLGLGLYIAERIVGAHDGRLAVTSSEASGTTFIVHLPRVAAPPVA